MSFARYMVLKKGPLPHIC